MASNSYRVVWPRSARTVEAKALAPRLTSLAGKTIGFVWDFLFRGDEIWPLLKQELSARYSGLKFVDHDAFGSTHGEDEHQVLKTMPAKIAQLKVDAIVSGMGC